MKVSEEEEIVGAYMQSSANWVVSDGSLEGSICFETSNSEDSEVIPTGVLFERPSDSPPCEITILFREKHEIHSIYVRSTARVFEVYYASDKEVPNNEYLCTVRCGADVQEMGTAMGERSRAEDSELNGINTDFSRGDSCPFMEDGWIEVDAPDSLFNNKRLSIPNISMESSYSKLQIKHEATAQISNASPCISVTLRLLSLENKTSICIDEIYIYADPVEETDPNSPACNGGSCSLLSMLVPGLLHLSQSGSSRLQDNGISDALIGPKCLSTTKETIHSTMMANFKFEEKLEHPLMESTSKMMADLNRDSKTNKDKNVEVCGSENLSDEPIVKHTQEGNMRLGDEAKGLGQSPLLINMENTFAYVRIENTLNDLVSRVGKIETFCSSFEECICKPLTRIEMKLQLLEERLDALPKAPMTYEACPTTSTTHFSAHESNLENDGSKTSVGTVDSPIGSHEKMSAVDLIKVSLSEAERSSGLMVKVPEFFSDDDLSISFSSADFFPNENPKNGKGLSIDSALASALAAFITSTADKSSSHISFPKDTHNQQKNSDISFPKDTHNQQKNSDMPSDEARQYEMCLNELFFTDVVDLDSALKKVDRVEKSGAQVIGNSLCEDDDSLIEIGMLESKGLIIRAPEFPSDDDTLDCAENSDPHASSFLNYHSNVIPPHQLDGMRTGLEPSTSNQNSITLSAFKTQEASDGMRTGLESCINKSVESSLVAFSSSQSCQEQTNIFHKEVAEEANGFSTEAYHVLKCNKPLAGRSKNCTQNNDFFSKLEASGSKTKSVYDSSFIRRQPHSECYDSNSLESFIGASSVFGLNGNSETTVHYQILDDFRQINLPFEDELTSYIQFHADEKLRSWLPIEVLLSEKHDEDPSNDVQFELGQEHLATNLVFSGDINSVCELPLEVFDETLFNEDNACHALLDMKDTAVRSEISSILKADALSYTECLSKGSIISSLI